MTPKEWAKYFREKHSNKTIDEIIIALRSAAEFGFWHKPNYAEIVIKEMKKLS